MQITRCEQGSIAVLVSLQLAWIKRMVVMGWLCGLPVHQAEYILSFCGDAIASLLLASYCCHSYASILSQMAGVQACPKRVTRVKAKALILPGQTCHVEYFSMCQLTYALKQKQGKKPDCWHLEQSQFNHSVVLLLFLFVKLTPSSAWLSWS